MQKLIITILLLMHYVLVNAQTDTLLVDPRDGKEYKVVQIGSQVWMAENLRYADSIVRFFKPGKVNSAPGFWFQNYERVERGFKFKPYTYCYDDNDFFSNKFGYLYTREAAIKACPVGWHLPNEQEFEKLLLTVSGETDLKKAEQQLIDSKALLPKGSSGLNLLYSGLLSVSSSDNDHTGKYEGLNYYTSFWVSSGKHHVTSIAFSDKSINFYSDYYSSALSVRCVKDSIP